MKPVAFCVLGLALVAAGCGPSDRKQFAMVEARVNKAREVPPSEPAKIIAAADEIARLEVKNPKAKAARDLCADAHRDRGRYYQLLSALEQKVREPVAHDPKVLAEEYRALDDMDGRLPGEIDRCNDALKAILTAR